MDWPRMLPLAMEREYELFERRSDGVLTWRGVVVGLEAARVQARLLSVETDHECFAMHAADKSVVARAMPAEVPTDLAA